MIPGLGAQPVVIDWDAFREPKHLVAQRGEITPDGFDPAILAHREDARKGPRPHTVHDRLLGFAKRRVDLSGKSTTPERKELGPPGDRARTKCPNPTRGRPDLLIALAEREEVHLVSELSQALPHHVSVRGVATGIRERIFPRHDKDPLRAGREDGFAGGTGITQSRSQYSPPGGRCGGLAVGRTPEPSQSDRPTRP